MWEKFIQENRREYRLLFFNLLYFIFSRLLVHFPRGRKRRRKKNLGPPSSHLKSGQCILSFLTQANEDSSRFGPFSPDSVYLGDSEEKYLAKKPMVVPDSVGPEDWGILLEDRELDNILWVERREVSRKRWLLVSLCFLLPPPPVTQSFERTKYPEPSSSALYHLKKPHPCLLSLLSP